MIKEIKIPVDTSIYRGWMLQLPILRDGSLADIPSEGASHAFVIPLFAARQRVNVHLYTRAALWLIWDFMRFTDIVSEGVPIYIACDASLKEEVQPYLEVSGFQNVLWQSPESYEGYSLHNRKFAGLCHEELQSFTHLMHIDAGLMWKSAAFDTGQYPLYEWLSGWQEQLFVTDYTPKQPSRVHLSDCRTVSDTDFYTCVSEIEGHGDAEQSKEYWSQKRLSVHGGIFGIHQKLLMDDQFIQDVKTLSDVTTSDEVALSIILTKMLTDSDFYMLDLPWGESYKPLNTEQDIIVSISNWQDETSQPILDYRRLCAMNWEYLQSESILR